MFDLDEGIFDRLPNRSASDKPSSNCMSDLLSFQDNLQKASVMELLRIDLLHLSTTAESKPNVFYVRHL